MSYEDGDSDGTKSLFNSGVAQTLRIDQLQKALNSARYNLRGFNPETGTFNYEIFINSLNGLFHEAWAKLSDAEKREGDKIYRIVQDCIELFSPVRQQKSERTGTTAPVIDEENMRRLKLILVIYERKIKEYLNKHNFNAPDYDNDDDSL